ncbi:MAG: hypothetical protein AAF747_10985 [Planctomycetota bacterium]
MNVIYETNTNGWNHAVRSRGVEIPLLHPNLVPDRSLVEAFKPRALPVWLRVWRWVFGGPLVKVPGGHSVETEHLRNCVKALVPGDFHEVINQLVGGELIQLYSAQQGAQKAWAEGIMNEVHADLIKQAAKAEAAKQAASQMSSRVGASPSMPGRLSRRESGWQPGRVDDPELRALAGSSVGAPSAMQSVEATATS